MLHFDKTIICSHFVSPLNTIKLLQSELTFQSNYCCFLIHLKPNEIKGSNNTNEKLSNRNILFNYLIFSSLKKAQVLQTQNGFSNSFCTTTKKRAFCEIVTMLLCEFIWPVQWIFVFLSFFRSLVRRKLFNSLALRGIANVLIEKRTQQFFQFFFFSVLYVKTCFTMEVLASSTLLRG
jgi:hypothetical protein